MPGRHVGRGTSILRLGKEEGTQERSQAEEAIMGRTGQAVRGVKIPSRQAARLFCKWSVEKLRELFDEDALPGFDDIRKALEKLAASYQGRAIELREVASGWRLQVREQYGPWVARLWEERPQRYSRAMLETLALIA